MSPTREALRQRNKEQQVEAVSLLHKYLGRLEDEAEETGVQFTQNRYCETEVRVSVFRWTKHFSLAPLSTADGETGAEVSTIDSLAIQDAGVIPGMLLVAIDGVDVLGAPYDEIITSLNSTSPATLEFKETFAQVLADIQSFDQRVTTMSPRMHTSRTSQDHPIIEKRSMMNAKPSKSTSVSLPHLHPRVSNMTIEDSIDVEELSSSQSGNSEPIQAVKPPSPDDNDPHWDRHPVIDNWPRRLQPDECNVIFHKRPLGIRVREDWEEKNAVVWKVEGEYAKKAGVERGSMIYTLNEENVQGLDHKEILKKLRTSQLPLKIIFWRTLMLSEDNADISRPAPQPQLDRTDSSSSVPHNIGRSHSLSRRNSVSGNKLWKMVKGGDEKVEDMKIETPKEPPPIEGFELERVSSFF